MLMVNALNTKLIIFHVTCTVLSKYKRARHGQKKKKKCHHIVTINTNGAGG